MLECANRYEFKQITHNKQNGRLHGDFTIAQQETRKKKQDEIQSQFQCSAWIVND